MGELRNLTDDDNGKTIDVKVGTKLLYDTDFGTSAYQWKKPAVEGDAVQFEGIEDCGPKKSGPPMAGEPQKGCFAFKAEKLGFATIELSEGYVSSDEKDVRLKVNVRVTK